MGNLCCGGDQQSDEINTKSAKEELTRAKSSSPYLMAEQKQDFAERNPDDFINQITVYVVQARNLPKYDYGPNSKSDPYVKVKFGKKQEFRTNTIRRELNPIWNAEFVDTGKALFSQTEQIEFSVYDHDNLSMDDFMGSCIVKTDKRPNVHYSTPVTWYPLLDNSKKPVIGKNGKAAEIQIKIKYTLNSEDANIRYYTHIMELTVKRGKNIRNKELFGGKSDPYVKLEWGAQTYETSYLKNTDQPVWNETAFLFVHEDKQDKYQLKLCVMDKDINADDQLGTGYIAASEVFKACKEGKTMKLDVNLRAVPVNLDRGLLDFTKNSTFKVWGDLEIEIKLNPKEVAEKEFYYALVSSFDKNNDGVIDKDEVREMFTQLKIPQDVDLFFDKFDENGDMKLDDKEVTKMLMDSDFQGSELATQLMAIYLEGGLDGDIQRHLMSGFTEKSVSTSKVIKIKDRETGLLVQEFVPMYVWYALKLVYNVKLNRAIVQSKAANKVLHSMSSKRGKKMDLPASADEIPGFIRQHNLDTRSLYKKPSEFKTFNDFFARGMKKEYRPLASPEDETVIVSPADCRMMAWDSILDSTKVWIKGSRFTLENLVGPKSKVDIKRYQGGSFVIARLAPQDYHRWHYPVSGKVVNIEKIDGMLYTVNPIAINKTVDVYSENKRAIVEIECGGKVGNVIMFVIAATMVGSYKLHRTDAEDPATDEPIPVKVGDVVKRGDVAGEFRFGGSTVLLLFEPGKVQFDEDILTNVKNKFETLVTVNSRIGQIR